METWEEIRDEVAGMLADGKPLEDVIVKLEQMKNEMAKASLLKAMDEMKKPKPHWIEENTRLKSFKWICSECGSTVYDMPMCSKKSYKKMCLYQYCPYCGVKMDLSEVAQ